MRASPERSVAVACVRYMRAVLPAGSIVATIVNEQRGAALDPMARARYGMARKASGVLSGFFDATALLPGGRVVWIEFKRPDGGVVSEAQQQVHRQARAIGHDVLVVTSVESARAGLQSLGVPLREAAGQPVEAPHVRLARPRVRITADAIPF